MNIVVCIDDDGGMLFNKRRQSRDRILIEDLTSVVQESGDQLWIAPFSEKLFSGVKEVRPFITVDENFLAKASETDFCFVENVPLQQYEDNIESLIIYRWNRKYPADTYLDIDLSKWQMEEAKEFPGSSHEKITREVYRK